MTRTICLRIEDELHDQVFKFVSARKRVSRQYSQNQWILEAIKLKLKNECRAEKMKSPPASVMDDDLEDFVR